MTERGLSPANDGLRDQAIRWVARVRSGRLSRDEQAELEEWLGEPAQAAAFREIRATWRALDALRSNPRLLELRERANRAAAYSISRRVGAAAALVALVLGLVVFAPQFAVRPAPKPQPLEFAAPDSGRLSVALRDGSTVLLDAGSIVRIADQAAVRRVELAKGRAYFQVRKDPRHPFTVIADGRSVTALGTTFTVDTGAVKFGVIVLSGRVRVAEARQGAQRQAVELDAGQQLVVSRSDWTLTKADLKSSTAWMSGQLVFENARLGDVAAELNRYMPGKLRIAADGTADKRIGAVLDVHDAETFIEAIRVGNVARVTTHEDGSVTLHQ